MGLRRIDAMPVTGHGTYMHMEGGKIVPAIEFDDETGELWVAGQKMIPPAASAMRRHAPAPAPDGRITSFVFPFAPSDASEFFLVWNGLIMGPNDYELSAGGLVTTGFTPQADDGLYGLY